MNNRKVNSILNENPHFGASYLLSIVIYLYYVCFFLTMRRVRGSYRLYYFFFSSNHKSGFAKSKEIWPQMIVLLLPPSHLHSTNNDSLVVGWSRCLRHSWAFLRKRLKAQL